MDTTKQRRVGARATKSFYDQNMRTLEERLETLDAQMAEIEATREGEEFANDRRGIIRKLRRKMN